MRKKIVLDTSVLIHDPNCVEQFGNNDIYITPYTLVELDNIKSSKKGDAAYSARKVIRYLDKLSSQGNIAQGVVAQNGETRVFVVARDIHEESESFNDFSYYDISIINYAKENDAKLVSKDLNMRLIAASQGVEAEDYITDKVDEKYGSSHPSVIETETSMKDNPFRPDSQVSPESLGINPDTIYENDFVKVEKEGGANYILICKSGHLKPIGDLPNFPVPRNDEQRMAMAAILDPDISMVSLLGKAGTGKTFIALACAIHLQGIGAFDKILLTKPVIPVGRDLGYLPGDMSEKIQPWSMSFYDNLDQIVTSDKSSENDPKSRFHKKEKNWEYYFDNGLIEIQTLHTVRGRSIPNSFILVDEVQNMTPHEVKTLITRAAEGTKVVLMGDPSQIDNNFLDEFSNGLNYASVRMRPSKITASVKFIHGERSLLAEEASRYL